MKFDEISEERGVTTFFARRIRAGGGRVHLSDDTHEGFVFVDLIRANDGEHIRIALPSVGVARSLALQLVSAAEEFDKRGYGG